MNDHVETAYSQASILIEVASDHLSAFVRAITQPALSISPWSSIRGVLEAASISRWLLDASLQAPGRASRSLQFRCEGLSQQVKFARVSGDDEYLKGAVRRLEDVLQHASTHGLELRQDAQATPKALLNPMPPTTDLIKDYLGEEAAYRLLSAMAHAHPWALGKLAFSAVRADQPKSLQKTLHIGAIAYMARLAFKASEAPIVDKCVLFGWPTGAISASFQGAIHEFQGIVQDVSGTNTRPA